MKKVLLLLMFAGLIALISKNTMAGTVPLPIKFGNVNLTGSDAPNEIMIKGDSSGLIDFSGETNIGLNYISKCITANVDLNGGWDSKILSSETQSFNVQFSLNGKIITQTYYVRVSDSKYPGNLPYDDWRRVILDNYAETLQSGLEDNLINGRVAVISIWGDSSNDPHYSLQPCGDNVESYKNITGNGMNYGIFEDGKVSFPVTFYNFKEEGVLTDPNLFLTAFKKKFWATAPVITFFYHS